MNAALVSYSAVLMHNGDKGNGALQHHVALRGPEENLFEVWEMGRMNVELRLREAIVCGHLFLLAETR